MVEAMSASDVTRAKPFLMMALKINDLQMVQGLVQRGYPINEPCDGVTPLLFAAGVSNEQVVQTIIDAGARLDATDSSGRNVLHFGCKSKNVAVFNVLNQRLQSAGLWDQLAEQRTAGGSTPLMYAVQSGEAFMVRDCLNQRMNPTKTDFIGVSCIDMAKQFQGEVSSHITRLLEQAIGTVTYSDDNSEAEAKYNQDPFNTFYQDRQAGQ